MENSELIRRFAMHERRRGLVPATVKSRGLRYQLLGRWLGAKRLTEVERDDIDRFLDGRQLTNRTRYRWISDLHCLYEWAVDEGHVPADPTARITRPKLPKLLPHPISSDDLAAAIDLAPPIIRAMLVLAAYEGMRCVEISNLVREDLLESMEPPVLIARGKGSKSRPLPIHPDVWKALKALPLPQSGPVFRRQSGVTIPPNEISAKGNDFLHDLGVESTMHKLRHWFGTSTYKSSKDLLLVRDLLGHANVATTEGYAAYDRSGANAAISALTATR